MKCVILQPSYIPWRGVFDQIHKADLFVFYDDVQYDTRGWRNRNRIKSANGPQWLTIPVYSQGAQTEHRPINSVEICWDTAWNQKHLVALRHAYSKAPHFARYEPMLKALFETRPRLLADFTIDLTVAIAKELGIAHTRFLRSSALPAAGEKTDRLLSILQNVGATHYISGPAAKEYMEEDKLGEAGITVEYMSYNYPEYKQLHMPYDPQVSILDLLFMEGPDAPRYIWEGGASQ